MRWSLQGNLYIGLTNIISHSEITYISCERHLTCRRTVWLLWSPIMGSQQNLNVGKPNTLPGNNTLSLMTLSPRSISKATGLARSNYMFEKCLCSFFFSSFCSFQKVSNLDSSANWWLQWSQAKRKL